jgi:hypothetical protein
MKATSGYRNLLVLLTSICLVALLSSCGSEDGGGSWDLPKPSETGIDPLPGSYSFSQKGCFKVIQDTASSKKFVVFASDCFRSDQIEINRGAFRNTWGQIDGTHCPTDAYGISGSFVTPTRAEGTIKYGFDCEVTSEAAFTAEFAGS